MRRWHLVTGLGVAFVSLVLVLALALLVFPSSPKAHREREPVTSFDDAKITAICDRSDPGESMGMPRPTVVDRIGGVDAAIFATSTRYSACIVFGAKSVEESGPTTIRQIPRGVGELESFGTIDKIPKRSIYTTDTWFVVRVSPTVSAIKASMRGFSQISKVRDQFAFVHEKEKADIRGKFVYGVATGFSSGSGVVGSAPLG